jgi:hypothetical protein
MNGAPASAEFGTHGSPPQQSALVEQALPAAVQAAFVQRGTPTLSGLHVSWVSQLPEQQSHEALHDLLASLQTSPFGLQEIGLRQTPSGPPAVKSHVTLPEPGPGRPAAPQQSRSWEHTSPTTWQPLAGWQTRTPVGPNGAHRRLQHDPPHDGTPASGFTMPPQTVPSTIEQFAAVVGGAPQVP